MSLATDFSTSLSAHDIGPSFTVSLDLPGRQSSVRERQFRAVLPLMKLNSDHARLELGVRRDPGEGEQRGRVDDQVLAPVIGVAPAVGHDDAELSADAWIDLNGRVRDVAWLHPLGEALRIEPGGHDPFPRDGNEAPDDHGIVVLAAHRLDRFFRFVCG